MDYHMAQLWIPVYCPEPVEPHAVARPPYRGLIRELDKGG
jgi:hypothetical protein